jgi:hypothetical protein
MKIYTKVVLDWDGNILEEESYDYEGPLALAGGGGGSSKTTQTSKPWEAQRPYLKEIFGEAQGLYNQGGPQLYPGQTIAGFTPNEAFAQQFATDYSKNVNIPLAGQAAGANQFLLGDVMMANANPYMASYAEGAIRPIYQQLMEQTLPSIRSSSIMGGGQNRNSRQQIREGLAISRADQAAMDTTARMYSDMYGDNLEAFQRGLALAPQTMQAGMIPAESIAGVGAQQRAYEQALMDEQARKFEYEQQLPWNTLAAYQNLVQGSYGGTGSVSGGGGASTASRLLGAGMTGLGTYGTIMGTPALAAAMGPAAPFVAGGMALASLFA